MGVFSSGGKRITGKGSKKRNKFSPGTYLVRVVKGVHHESQMGYGTFVGIETKILAVEDLRTAAQNAPHDATRPAGSRASYTFKEMSGAMEDIYLQNLANLAEALMETYGFEDCLNAAEQAELIGLIERAEQGGENADPVAYVLDLLVDEGGERLAGLPLRIEAKGKTSKAGNLFCVCHCHPVTRADIDAAEAA